MRLRVTIAVLLFAAAFAARPARAQENGEFFNPYVAEKDVEVGSYYLKKKNYDAAIERFLDAIVHKSNHAKAHRLLGEAYEKKGDLDSAVEFYERYLKILPSAEDAPKIRKRIDKLKREIAKRAARKRRESP